MLNWVLLPPLPSLLFSFFSYNRCIYRFTTPCERLMSYQHTQQNCPPLHPSTPFPGKRRRRRKGPPQVPQPFHLLFWLFGFSFFSSLLFLRSDVYRGRNFPPPPIHSAELNYNDSDKDKTKQNKTNVGEESEKGTNGSNEEEAVSKRDSKNKRNRLPWLSGRISRKLEIPDVRKSGYP